MPTVRWTGNAPLVISGLGRKVRTDKATNNLVVDDPGKDIVFPPFDSTAEKDRDVAVDAALWAEARQQKAVKAMIDAGRLIERGVQG
jgi:hypothetical protein